MPDDPPSSTFRSTRWSMVQQASGDDQEAFAALEEFCRDYRPPLLSFARRVLQQSPEDAEDLVQGFISGLISGKLLSKADRTRGRFRSFLHQGLKNHFLHVREKAATARRGGGNQHIRLEAADELGVESTVEMEVDREWAETTMQRARERLARDYRSRGKGALFDALSRLTSDAQPGGYRKLAGELETTEAQLALNIHRFRRRLRDARRGTGNRRLARGGTGRNRLPLETPARREAARSLSIALCQPSPQRTGPARQRAPLSCIGAG
jgi:DNA-directed RNA polymerase specialized sigma24 family protein